MGILSTLSNAVIEGIEMVEKAFKGTNRALDGYVDACDYVARRTGNLKNIAEHENNKAIAELQAEVAEWEAKQAAKKQQPQQTAEQQAAELEQE